MKTDKNVPLMLTISKQCRDRLRQMAAEENLKDPSKVTSAATIAKNIVCEHLKNEINEPRQEIAEK